mgnify:CR=1 FL=1
MSNVPHAAHPDAIAEEMERRRRRSAPLTGIVLSGGGARGAYEAGILRYIRDELPPKVRAHARFEIVCGTSVGAINGCFLAANAHQPELQGRAISQVWERLRIEGVYRVGWKELKNLPRFLLGSRGRGQLDDAVGVGRLGGLLNTAPLEQLIARGMRWNNIKRNLETGDLYALAINATHIASGKTHTFVQRQGGGLPPWSTDPQVEARAVTIGPHHTLASAAIPWIFPAVDIDGDVYCDGGLKLNTPISPALRLGADRILVIGLRHEEEDQPDGARVEQFPSAAFLLGKILNALMNDKTEYDLNRLRRFNAILEAGEQAFGDTFTDALGNVLTPMRGAPYRKVQTLMIRPRQDMASIANKHARMGSVAARAGGLVGPLIRRLGETADNSESDLLSYLLFDGEYAADLVRMGMRDADAHRQDLIDFFQV